MKYILAVSLSFLLCLFSSCEKESFFQPELNDMEMISIDTNDANKSWGLNQKWWSVIGECTHPPKDCFDEIIVKPQENQKYMRFVDILEGTKVSDLFMDKRTMQLFPELANSKNNSILNELRKNKFSYKIFKKENVDYLIFIDESTEKQYVFPVRLID